MSSLIPAVSQVWKKFSLHQPIRYTFLDESYARMYDDVQRMGNIFESFAILAIIVACLGLFALSTFMIEQRNKEISIRLVLGASLKSILQLVTINYIKLVLIAVVLAIPLSFYLMHEWLKEFAYRIDITWQSFAVAGVLSFSIALATVSFQSIRAALSNPVDSLKEQ
jgi:putative ABC transport system permease protein